MARNFINIFSTIFFFVMIIMASFTAQMTFSEPHNPSVRELLSDEEVGVSVEASVGRGKGKGKGGGGGKGTGGGRKGDEE
ncbi:hypothetical protein MKW92_009999 [Papaver armeniacum]|nr:hypothetical protein MKW92_009999 [Papaver armeniacum]